MTGPARSLARILVLAGALTGAAAPDAAAAELSSFPIAYAQAVEPCRPQVAAERETRIASMLASIEVRHDEALFATFAWLNLAGKTAADTAGLAPAGRHAWERLREVVSAADLARYRTHHAELDAAYGHMVDYLGTVLALNMSPPPELRVLSVELSEWNATHGVEDRWTEKRLAELEPLAAIIREFYGRYPVRAIFEECRPWYEPVGASDLQRAGDVVRRSVDTLRLAAGELPALSRIAIVPNLLGSRGEMGPEYRGVKYDVKGPRVSSTYRAHEFLHSLVAGCTRDPAARERIIAAIGPTWEAAAGTPAVGSYPDPVLWFDDCLVRALDAVVMHPDDADARTREAAFEAERGFTLVPDILAALDAFARAEVSFPGWFPELLTLLASP
ncbi:MAG: hypothetical protein R6X25_02455 [Candidatus Krumholzibacteriia bacterium]